MFGKAKGAKATNINENMYKHTGATTRTGKIKLTTKNGYELDSERASKREREAHLRCKTIETVNTSIMWRRKQKYI